jgi:hypothetical protein
MNFKYRIHITGIVNSKQGLLITVRYTSQESILEQIVHAVICDEY